MTSMRRNRSFDFVSHTCSFLPFQQAGWICPTPSHSRAHAAAWSGRPLHGLNTLANRLLASTMHVMAATVPGRAAAALTRRTRLQVGRPLPPRGWANVAVRRAERVSSWRAGRAGWQVQGFSRPAAAASGTAATSCFLCFFKFPVFYVPADPLAAASESGKLVGVDLPAGRQRRTQGTCACAACLLAAAVGRPAAVGQGRRTRTG